MAQAEKLFIRVLLVSIFACLIYTPAHTSEEGKRQPETVTTVATPPR
jgi:hypothetical protein